SIVNIPQTAYPVRHSGPATLTPSVSAFDTEDAPPWTHTRGCVTLAEGEGTRRPRADSAPSDGNLCGPLSPLSGLLPGGRRPPGRAGPVRAVPPAVRPHPRNQRFQDPVLPVAVGLRRVCRRGRDRGLARRGPAGDRRSRAAHL